MRVRAEHRRVWSRLMLATASAVLLSLVSLVSHAVSPVIAINEEAKTANIQSQHIRGNLTVLSGSGGNVTVLAAGDEKLLIDGGIAYSRQNLERALAAISPGRIQYLIDTHYHWDHTDSNGWLHQLGATIVAQDNTLKRLSVDTRVDDWEWTFPASPVEARPTVLLRTAKTIRFHGSTVELKYYGPCHTDSDIWAYFIEANVLSTGDTFWNGVYPFIDNENGGSIDGMIRAANANIAKVGPDTIVVPGHGPLGGRAELIEFRDMLVAIREKVARLKHQGMSRDQVVAAKPSREFDAKWGGFVLDGAFFTRIVYDGLAGGAPRQKQ
jgi:glyoxylase-like metal-dependent hydrolase (beta-lactamase superfamily II)